MHAQRREEYPTFHINKKKDNPLGAYDVICGRHKAAFDNIGNRRFRVLVALAQNKYTSAPTRALKTCVIRSIIDSVHNGGGRFLQRLACTWVELDAKQTHEKVGHALRDMAIASKLKTKSSTIKSPIVSIHGKDLSRHMTFCTVGIPQSFGPMSSNSVSASNTMVDGYVVKYSGNCAVTENHQYMNELFVDDDLFLASRSIVWRQPSTI
jgi:hypothetical protein